jgi:hypothetical protein
LSRLFAQIGQDLMQNDAILILWIQELRDWFGEKA